MTEARNFREEHIPKESAGSPIIAENTYLKIHIVNQDRLINTMIKLLTEEQLKQLLLMEVGKGVSNGNL